MVTIHDTSRSNPHGKRKGDSSGTGYFSEESLGLSILANLASLVLSLLKGMDGEASARVCTGNSLSRDRAWESEDVPKRRRLPGILGEARTLPWTIWRYRLCLLPDVEPCSVF